MFKYLKDVDVKGTVAKEYELHQIPLDPVPVLMLKPATEANKPYFNALLKQSGKALANMRSGSITAKMTAERREQDKALYAKYIIDGWKNIPDENGQFVPFNKKNCEEFLEQLPDWIFDDVRAYAAKPENYLNDEAFSVEVKAQD